MTQLRLYLFGPPRVKQDGTWIEVRPRKALALLVYLAVTAQPHSRDALATLLWPESDQRAARASLRRTLYQLNQLLPEKCLAATPEIIGFASDADLWLDVTTFQQYVVDCPPQVPIPAELTADRLARFLAATRLYTDDFLAGFTLPDSPAFDDWQFFQREELRQTLVRTLKQLIEIYQGQRSWEAALSHGLRWLAADPLHEPAHRQLMQLYTWSGQRAAALRQYQECVRLLQEELGVPPEEETTALYEAIKTKRLPGPEMGNAAEETLPCAPSLSPGGSKDSLQSSARKHNLPTQPTPFVGRKKELAEIRYLLVNESNCRLLTLLGPGGIGKTRLSLQVADAVHEAFPDGVYFVPLTGASETVFIVPAIGEALNFRFRGSGDLKTQLLNHLRTKKLLLLLDNFDHLLKGAAFLSEILSAAPQVTLLVTSRQRLNLQEEWGYPVRGMRFPQTASRIAPPDLETFEDYSAVNLFVQQARRADTRFALSADVLPAVVRICRLVEGMPLALELAATWVRSMSCAEIAEEIERNLDFLTTPVSNVPERHRSLRVVFEQTWQRLSQTEQSVLKKLSVFRGGCQRQAADQVADTDLSLLTLLVDKSLLHRTRNNRYEMHELIRQFAAEQLRADPDCYERVHNRHCVHYTSFLHHRTLDLKMDREQEALLEIAADIDNVRAAWQRAVACGDAQALEQAAESLWLFHEYRGALEEGEAAFQQAVARLTADPARTADYEHLVGFLLAMQGYLGAQRGGLQRGQKLIEAGLLRLQRAWPRHQKNEAISLAMLAHVFFLQGKYAEATQSAQEGLKLCSALGERFGVAMTLSLLGAVAQAQGQLARAEQILQECLAVCQESGILRIQAHATLNLAIIAIVHGAYDRAQQLLDETDRINQEFDDELSMADVLYQRGRLAMMQGDYTRAMQQIQKSLTIVNEIGSTYTAAARYKYLGVVLRAHGKLEEAEQVYRESLAASKAAGHQPHIASNLRNLGCLVYERGAYAQAERFLQESLAIWQQLDHELEIASVLVHLGHTVAASAADRQSESKGYFQRALQLATKHGMVPIVLNVFVGMAGLLAREGESQEAATLLSLVENHTACTEETRANARELIEALAVDLSPAALAAATAQGRSFGWQRTAERLLGLPPHNECPEFG